MFIAVIAIIMSFIVVGALVNPYVADFDGQDIRAARRRRVCRERRAMRRDRRAARRDARLLRAIEEPTRQADNPSLEARGIARGHQTSP